MAICAFCEREATLTREHLWPQWLRDVAVDNRPGPHAITADHEIQTIWEAPMFSQTVRCVCGQCNSGWMSDLEVAVRPVLTPLILNHHTALTPPQQELLAAWAMKTTLVSKGRDRVTRMPAEHFRHLHSTGRPPSDVVISLAAYGGRRYPAFAGHHIKPLRVRIADQAPIEAKMYFATVSVGHVVFQVFGHGIANVVRLRPKNWKVQYARVIWPDPSQDLGWPPSVQLTDRLLRQFASQV